MSLSLLSCSPEKQRGAATLFVAVIMLVAITLVALVSSKTVVNETKMAANNYRTTQAVAAANYAMDLGVNYFDTGGFDRLNEKDSSGNLVLVADGNAAVLGNDSVTDSVIDIDNDGDYDSDDVNMNALSLVSTDGKQTLSATLSFNNSGCGAAGLDFKGGEITATGFSDDGEAMRIITRCVGPLAVLRNDGPKQPLVAQGQVALTGNARIINRFTSTTIWSGGQVTIGSSSAMETYIRSEGVTLVDEVDSSGNPVDDSDSTTLNISDPTDMASLLSTDDSAYTQLVSNRNLGNGLDIIDDDSSLDTLIGLDFFKNFFHAASRGELKLQAGSQVYTDLGSALNTENPEVITSGLVWIEGDQLMTGGTIGSLEKPAIVYVHGDFRGTGGAKIIGILYVAGTYTVAGGITIVGANIVEGTDFSGTDEAPATPPVVTGHGTLSLIYWAGITDSGTNNVEGQSAVIAGSWRDW